VKGAAAAVARLDGVVDDELDSSRSSGGEGVAVGVGGR